MGGHELVYSHDRDQTKIKLICHETTGADCWTEVLEPDWDAGPTLGRAQRRDHGSCLVVEHFDLDNITPELEQHPGTNFEIGRFPVSVHWDGDEWVWERVVDEERAIELDFARRTLKKFKERQQALGRSANTPFERDLAESLETALTALGKGR